MENITREILDLEWEMLGSMEDSDNKEEERPVFELMRKAQFDAWPEDLKESYLEDLQQTKAAGQNLQQEKFTRMLEHIAPEEYEKKLAGLPAVPEERIAAVKRIWEMMKPLNQIFAEQYPVLGMSGRPLTKDSETDIPSIETYQCCEMLTYSLRTLDLLENFLKKDIEEGNNLVSKIQYNTVKGMGFRNLEEAEKELAWATLTEMGGQHCSNCGMEPAF